MSDRCGVKLDMFEGPMDLLLHLIDSQELDITDIPVALVTHQYLEYLKTMEEMDLEIASEWLVMAATLLRIKSRMLLPIVPMENISEEGVLGGEMLDPRAELVAQLLEYKRFKLVVQELHSWEAERAKMIPRQGMWEELRVQQMTMPPGGPTSVDLLMQAFQGVLARVADAEPKRVTREEITVRQRMADILRALALSPQGISFEQLFSATTAIREIVVTFMALLELIKLGRIEAYQEHVFSEIRLYRPNVDLGVESTA